MPKILARLSFTLIFALALQGGASAATKIKLLYTAAPPFLASFVAQDQGFFSKRSLDVDFELVATGGVIIPALVGGSGQIGGPTVTVLLQANEAGLEVLALAAAEKFPTPYKLGLVAREGSNIRTAADLAEKSIGVPGLNGVIDVMTRKFIAQAGLKETQVKRVELGFPQMGDSLKSGKVDVVAAADPFFTRIVEAKIGSPLTSFSDVVPPGTVAAVYVSTKSWATQNQDAVRSFREALAEANLFIQVAENDAAVRQSLAKYTKLPPQVANTLTYPKAMDPDLKPENLQFWIDASLDQQLITKKVDPATLIASRP
jgi:NitT/TauT family transport system substrate-binding protein